MRLLLIQTSCPASVELDSEKREDVRLVKMNLELLLARKDQFVSFG